MRKITVGNVTQFISWAKSAAQGDKFTYHIGELSPDIHEHYQQSSVDEMKACRKKAQDLWVSGWFELFQERNGPHSFRYICVKRGTHAPGRSGLTFDLAAEDRRLVTKRAA